MVTLTGRLVPLQMKKANIKSEADIKRIYRKAKPVDMEKYNEAKAREHATMIRSRQIALDLNLNMKIGDVEYQETATKPSSTTSPTSVWTSASSSRSLPTPSACASR